MENIINNMFTNGIIMINDKLSRPIADRLIYIHCGIMYSYYIPLFITNNDFENMNSLLFSNDTDRTLDHMKHSKNALNYNLKNNDMVFSHNHRLFHGRTPFKDSEEIGKERELLRVWIKTNLN